MNYLINSTLQNLIGKKVYSLHLLSKAIEGCTEKFIINIENEVAVCVYFEYNKHNIPAFRLELILNIQNDEVIFSKNNKISGFSSNMNETMKKFLGNVITFFSYDTLIGKSGVQLDRMTNDESFEVGIGYDGPPGERPILFTCERLEEDSEEIYLSWFPQY